MHFWQTRSQTARRTSSPNSTKPPTGVQVLSFDLKYLIHYVHHSHLATIETHAFTEAFIQVVDPTFMIDIVKLYLEYGPNECPQGQTTAPILQKANVSATELSCSLIIVTQLPQRQLEVLTKLFPGLIEGVYLQARVKYLSGGLFILMITVCHGLESTCYLICSG